MADRRTFVKTAGLALAGLALGMKGFSAPLFSNVDFSSMRPALKDRKFVSKTVEETILTVKKGITDPELAWLFENCFPNTLDTTVNFRMIDGKPDTFVITGDINAMWLRDSTAQVWSYLPLTKGDAELHERKYEIDSLCYPVRFSYGYWKTNDPLYLNTRKFIFSDSNPYYFKGKVVAGVGGPHSGMNMIWPLSFTMKALTSTSDKEITDCIRTLKSTHSGTGFMHESFFKDDASKFTRKWFAWANTLFGEMILKVYHERSHLLKQTF